MTAAPDRRAFFGLVAIAVGGPVAGHMEALNAVGDAALLQFGQQWQEHMQEHDRISCILGKAADEAEVETLDALHQPVLEAIDQIEAAVAAIPARTIAGLQVKAKIAERYGELARLGPVEQSLVADGLREMQI